MENYKHLYEQEKLMLEKYQDEIVHKLREQLEQAKLERDELRDDFIDFACSGMPNLAPFCRNKVDRKSMMAFLKSPKKQKRLSNERQANM